MRAFIADMKLRELRRARDRLTAAYDALEAEADAAAHPRDALLALTRGLSALKVGDRRVHPDVGNLDVAAHGDPALVARWITRLRTELRQGRARADVLPVFGGALGEQLRVDRALPAPPDDLVAPWCEPSSPASLVAMLDARVSPEALAKARAIVKRKCAEFFEPDSMHTTPPDDLLTAEARGDRAAVGSEITPDGTLSPLHLDWQSALRLAWEDIAAWDWPARFVTLRPTWTRNRWRLRPVMDLPTAAIVEAIGDGVESLLGAVSGRARLNRRLRLQRLEELNAPEVIVDNERRMVDECVDLLGGIGADDALGDADTVRRHRVAMRGLEGSDDYDYARSDIAKVVSWLDAEVTLAQAHGRPLYVLKTDVEAYYPSVSHALVEALLQWLEVDPRLVALVGRVLSVPLPDGTRTTRGIPLGLRLSRAIGEFVVTAILGEVRAAAPVDATAMVDDIVVVARRAGDLSRAWATAQRCARAAGLSLHPTKSGASAVGDALPGDVPRGPVRWGMLRMEGGRFTVDRDEVDAFAALTRARFDAHGALLDRVTVWREQLRYAWTWLAPVADLGGGHLVAVESAVSRVCGALGDALRRDIEARFLDGATSSLPDAWLHWPLTAGGLGAPYVLADLVPLRMGSSQRERLPVPAAVDDPDDDRAWGKWFAQRLTPLASVAPVETPSMAALEARFVERGKRIGRAARALSPHWKWVLHTLGPDILDAYGTFDFVATDLVPIDLVRRGGDAA